MSLQNDPRRDIAKATPIVEIINRLGISGLRRTGAEMVGPCPICGGRDRFGVNLTTNQFLCRKCDIRGGDQISLVEQVMGVNFRDALSWLTGDAINVDHAEMERRREKALARSRQQEAYGARQRAQAIRDARSIWSRAEGQDRDPVRAYLARRGIDVARLPGRLDVLRCLPDHACVRKIDQDYVTVHRGPAMIAAIMNRAGDCTAVHQTWIDLDQPNGRATINHAGGALPSKIVRGSQKGCVIPLVTETSSPVLIMGEGIETTLSAAMASPVSSASYWAGINLGNMAGGMRRVEGRKWSGIPDMSDQFAFSPPDWVRRLIYIQDGDSNPKMTRAKLECGLRRAMALRPGLTAQIVHPGAGVDLNDLLMGEGPKVENHENEGTK